MVCAARRRICKSILLSSLDCAERMGLMKPPRDEMKLGVLSHVFLKECNGSSASSFTTVWFAS